MHRNPPPFFNNPIQHHKPDVAFHICGLSKCNLFSHNLHSLAAFGFQFSSFPRHKLPINLIDSSLVVVEQKKKTATCENYFLVMIDLQMERFIPLLKFLSLNIINLNVKSNYTELLSVLVTPWLCPFILFLLF